MADTPLILYKNADFIRIVTWKDSNQNPINVTGYRAAFRIQPSAAQGQALNAYESGGGANDGTIVINGPAGTFTITIPHAQTKNVAFPDGNCELLVQKSTAPYTITSLFREPIQVQGGTTPIPNGWS